MMRIDSHQHFWKYNLTDYVWMSEVHEVLKRDFLPDDLQPLLQAANIQGTIAVQASSSSSLAAVQCRPGSFWLKMNFY